MSFELVIAARRDPSDDTRAGDASPASCSSASVVLNGLLDGVAVEAITSAVGELITQNVGSIVLKLQDVTVAAGSQRAFARAVMALRSTGIHIQVLAMDEALRTRLAGAEDARDWLLDVRGANADMPRHAVHLDGPGKRPRRTTEPD